MAAPSWAIKMVKVVARHSRRRAPVLGWRTHRRFLSSGSYTHSHVEKVGHDVYYTECDGYIYISAGRDYLSTKITLLHELAHWLVSDKSARHDDVFWEMAWKLYRQFRLPVSRVLLDEGRYKQGAVTAYWKSRNPSGRKPKIQRVVVKVQRALHSYR